MTLDLLSSNDAVEVLRSVLGPERVAAEREAANELSRLCGYLQMITFKAWQDERYIGLAELLLRLGEQSLSLMWSCAIDELAHESGTEQIEALDPKVRVSALKLIALVAPDRQIIDGTFDGYQEGTDHRVLQIRAVDSSDWDIESSDTDILNRFKTAYNGSGDWIGPLDAVAAA